MEQVYEPMKDRRSGERPRTADTADGLRHGPGAPMAMAASLPTRQKVFIGLLSFLLVVPVDMLGASHQGFPLPLCILLLPASWLSFLQSRSPEALLLLLASLLGDVSILLTTPFAAHASLRPLGSFLLFFSPVACYFLARKTIRTNPALLMFLRCSLFASLSLACSLFLSVFVFGNGEVRGGGLHEGTLNGTYFLLPLSGAFGVHTLVAHYFLICIIVVYYAGSGYASRLERALAFLVVLLLLYLMLFSISREIIIAILFVSILLMFRSIRPMRALLLLSLLSLGFYMIFQNLSSLDSTWETTIDRTVNAASLNELSSGRLELQALALKQLLRSPLTGTGFNGYEFDNPASETFVDLTGWSTHIYYLTVIWKMGLLGACAFLLFLGRITKASVAFSRHTFPRSARLYSIALCAFLLILNLFWDALLAPSVMCLFAFFVGSMSRTAEKAPLRPTPYPGA